MAAWFFQPAVHPPVAAGAAGAYTILWQQQVGKAALPPAVSPWGDVYLVTGSGLLRLDDRGRLLWEFRTSERPTSAPVFLADGSTFIATGRGVYEAKPFGRAGWSFNIICGEKSGSAAPNLAQGPGDLFYLVAGLGLYAVEPRANLVWYVGEAGDPVAADADSRHVFLARHQKGTCTSLAALDATGQTLWQQGLPEQKVLHLALSRDGKHLYAAGIPKTLDRLNKTAVYAFDAALGQLLWQKKFNHREISSVTVGPDGLLYLVAGKRYLYVLDPATGEEVFSTALGELSGAAPAVDGRGTVYVPGKERLYALSSSTGRLLWEAALEGGLPHTPALGTDGSTVYLLTGKGTLIALQNNRHGVE